MEKETACSAYQTASRLFVLSLGERCAERPIHRSFPVNPHLLPSPALYLRDSIIPSIWRPRRIGSIHQSFCHSPQSASIKVYPL